MALYLLNTTRTPVEFQREKASALSYPALSGSQVLTYQSPSLQLYIKELVTELFTIRFNVFRFFKNQAIESVSHHRGIHSRVMLQNNLQVSIADIGPLYQQENSIALIWSDSAHCKAFFEAGNEYTTLDIYLAPCLVEQQASLFPQVSLIAERPLLILPQPILVTPGVKKVITDILDCPYDAATSQFYFDLKVREYLYVLLEQLGRAPQPPVRFTAYEAEQVHRARELLLAHLDQPPLTIRELARKVALNEYKLKVGFRHFFNMGVFECLQQARLERARHLLLHTAMPLKEVCGRAGYPRVTNFITAFRKHFGYTPGSLRRQP